MLTREEAEALVVQFATYPEHDQEGKARLRAAAGRKHQREAEDFAEFAAVDQAAYAERIAASVTRVTADLETARDAVAEAEDKAAGALRAERAAQDRAREHAEHARRQQEEWKRVQRRGTPREQTEALIASQAAAQVAQGEQAAAEGATAARELAGRELEAARGRVCEIEEAVRAAREAAASPGRAFSQPGNVLGERQPPAQDLGFAAAGRAADGQEHHQHVRDDHRAVRRDQAKRRRRAGSRGRGKRPQSGAFTLPVAAGVAGGDTGWAPGPGRHAAAPRGGAAMAG